MHRLVRCISSTNEKETLHTAFTIATNCCIFYSVRTNDSERSILWARRAESHTCVNGHSEYRKESIDELFGTVRRICKRGIQMAVNGITFTITPGRGVFNFWRQQN